MLGEWGLTHYFRPDWYHCDPTAYAAVLMNAYVRSQTALYSRLDDDIRNDVVRIANFVPVARRLIDMDGKREKSLAFVPVLSGPEIANAKARISENSWSWPGCSKRSSTAQRPIGSRSSG